jgi:hypothetical protein
MTVSRTRFNGRLIRMKFACNQLFFSFEKKMFGFAPGIIVMKELMGFEP